MAGKVLDLKDIVSEDHLGCRIAEYWHSWNSARQKRVSEWAEVRSYIHATDTGYLEEGSLPWKNTTHIPKICQIRDNLHANYIASMFPKRKWLFWQGDTEEDEEKAKSIESYMQWVVSQDWYEPSISKLVLDYLDYGICIGMPEWLDETSVDEKRNNISSGYVGPYIKRISPLDIVFNPAAPDFQSTPKIVRSLVTLGELKKILEKETSDDQEREQAEAVFNYLVELRRTTAQHSGDLQQKDSYYEMDGFTSFKHYLGSDYVEILTFYGDIYDHETDTLLENYIVTVVDRHKILFKKKNVSYFGYPTFVSAVWRERQDNLWGMGPFDNLLGLQFRLNSVENQKADMVDLTTIPPLKVKGYVEDFEYGPMERIYVGDDGDVEVLLPDFNPVAKNIDIQTYESRMEEMAGSPKEAMGFRTPGEKTAFEVQRLENASSRIFQSKISHFEKMVTEKLLNFFLEMAKRNLSKTVIRSFDDELQVAHFQELTPMDITGSGRIKPVAARHFAEKAEFIQNISSFYQSGVGSDPEVRAHLSSIKLASLVDSVLDAEDYKIFEPFIRMQEKAEAEKLMNVQKEDVQSNMMTDAQLSPDDIDDVSEEELEAEAENFGDSEDA